MTSEQPPLMNGDEDPYKSEGRIELKIENFAGFSLEAIDSERLSDPTNVCGVPWKMCAVLRECDGDDLPEEQHGQKLVFYLEYNGSTDPSCRYEVTAKLKVLAQKKGGDVVDHVFEIDRLFKFNSVHTDCSLLGQMTIQDLMNPDKGLYDERNDSTVLALDLKMDVTEGVVGEYILVAQNELTLEKVPTVFSMQIGNLQWQIDYDVYYEFGHEDDDQQNTRTEERSVFLACKDMAVTAKARGVDSKVLVELFGYRKSHSNRFGDQYSPIFDDKSSTVRRHLFTRSDNSLTFDLPNGRSSNNILFTFRVLKERSQFQDFTKQTVMVGRFPADLRLRVGDVVFHVNKQLLSSLSPYFDRMFNGPYPTATQQEVELSLLTHSPELFHDFLLVLCVNDALPNSMIVEALFKLADFYDAENVRQKCDQHIRKAREMPVEKRVLLARDFGTKQTQDLIVESVDLEQAKRISTLFMQNR